MRFLGFVLRTPPYRAHFRRESTGLGTGTAGFLRLNDNRFLETTALIPPFCEQAAIVRFLDSVDRRIRRYIRGKQKLIALLEEQKQAIIHQAVTGQIDVRTGQPYPAYKSSGVESLADMPEHWGTVSAEECRVGGHDRFPEVGHHMHPIRDLCSSVSGISVVVHSNCGSRTLYDWTYQRHRKPVGPAWVRLFFVDGQGASASGTARAT